MRNLRTFNVIPNLPPPLERLRDLAYNLWWTWDPSARELFIRLDRDLWELCDNNPILVLTRVSQERLREVAEDDSYIGHLQKVTAKLDHYLRSNNRWYSEKFKDVADRPIGYFSMEFGLDSCIRLYSGGLGVLAGDHLKAASDLGIPIVGVGLFYRNGYFRQYLNADGWQQETYPEYGVHSLPLHPARDAKGEQVKVRLRMGDRWVHCIVWEAHVGRVPLYLLDSHSAENSPEDRRITASLYGGDQETRIQQEKILGVGGLRALRAMGIEPAVCHMNEGHSAFLAIERIRQLMETHRADFEAARQTVLAGNVFTTHTPVPAGNDEFPKDLVQRYLADLVEHIGVPMEKLLALGRTPKTDGNAPFSMTILALRLSCARNGVSELHGQVSRRMWQVVWPEYPVDEIPIRSITNGVHLRSWLSGELQELYDRYIGTKWLEGLDDDVWSRVDKIPNPELWREHERRRERLVAVARTRLRQQLARRGAPAPEIMRADEVLNPEALTIGFARRFATYKRATLLFSDLDRLHRILTDPQRPAQIIFAGKAHPRDDSGKELIRQIIHTARQERFRQHIVFLEDYDMNIARYLVQGADIWLNTPRRPLEASGTSGIKAAANGVLHVSVLDGWWVEGYEPERGWAIGLGEVYEDPVHQDLVEGRALYSVLEQEILPLFYDRGKDGLPRNWIARMKASMGELSPRFGMHRVVKEYAERFYARAQRHYTRLLEDEMSRAKLLSKWLTDLERKWGEISITKVELEADGEVPVGSSLTVRAIIKLGSVGPHDVNVQLQHGPLGADGGLAQVKTTEMALSENKADGQCLFKGTIACSESGEHGFSVRVLPSNPDLSCVHETHLVLWSS